MVTPANSQTPAFNFRRIAALACLCMSVAVVGSQEVHAFGKIVHDPKTLIKQIQEYQEQAKRWQQQLQQYQSTLGKPDMLFKSPSFNMELTLQERAPNESIAERCPDPSGSGGGMLGSMFDMFKPDLGGNIYKQQQVVCINIVLLENKKYNELVQMVRDADKRKQEVDKMINDAAKDSDPGAMASSTVKAQELMGKSLAEMQYSLARIQAFDGMIDSLQTDQQTLAKQALSGSQNNFSAAGLLGKVVQGATLELALQAARARER